MGALAAAAIITTEQSHSMQADPCDAFPNMLQIAHNKSQYPPAML